MILYIAPSVVVVMAIAEEPWIGVQHVAHRIRRSRMKRDHISDFSRQNDLMSIAHYMQDTRYMVMPS